MSSSMNQIASDLYKSLTESNNRKPKPYDTKAEVLREEGNTVWVKIPGGIDETPVQKTNNAKAGDTVMVRVSGGRAWLLGNNTSPATDDTRANQAYQVGSDAGAVADLAIKEAGRAQEAANLAEAEAGRAHTAAEQAQAAVVEIEGDIDSLSGRVDTAEATVTAMETTVSGLNTRVTTAEGNITSIEGRVTTAEGDITAVEGSVSSLNTRVGTAEGKVATLEGEVSTLDTNVGNLATRVTTAEGNISDVESDITDLTGRVSTAEGNITSIGSRVTTAEGNITTIEGNITSLGSRVTTAEGDITTVEGNISTLQTRVTTAEGNITLIEEKAQDASDAADTAQTAADNAQASADSAAQSANTALSNLGIIENVVGVLNLLQEHGDYEVTTNEDVIPDKWYFKKMDNGGYEVVNAPTSVYHLTEDTAIDSTKTYYTRTGTGTEEDPYIYTEVDNPVVADIGTYYEKYYELVGIDEAVQNYVSSQLVVDGQGLWLKRPDSTGIQSKVLLSATDGVVLYGTDGNIVGKYGQTAQIGDVNGLHIEMDGTELGFYQGANKVAYIRNNQLFIEQSVVVKQMDVGLPFGQINPATGETGLGQWSWKVHPNKETPKRNNLYLKWLG